jgi:biotin transport system substrate-specific component
LEKKMNKSQIRQTVMVAVFTALISAGSYVAVPIGPVPIVLTNFFVLLSGLLCGFRIGLYSTAAYVLLGILGLPVFAGGSGGFAVLAGPTGGFLIGYLLTASSAGLIYKPSEGAGTSSKIGLASLAGLIAGILVYLPGVPWLKMNLELSWGKAFQLGMLPFIPGDLLKIVAAVALTITLRDRFSDFLKAE